MQVLHYELKLLSLYYPIKIPKYLDSFVHKDDETCEIVNGPALCDCCGSLIDSIYVMIAAENKETCYLCKKYVCSTCRFHDDVIFFLYSILFII